MAETSGVAEIVMVGNSVEAAMVTEVVAETGLSFEESVGTDVDVVTIPWAVEFVVGETVAEAVVAV